MILCGKPYALLTASCERARSNHLKPINRPNSLLSAFQKLPSGRSYVKVLVRILNRASSFNGSKSLTLRSSQKTKFAQSKKLILSVWILPVLRVYREINVLFKHN